MGRSKSPAPSKKIREAAKRLPRASDLTMAEGAALIREEHLAQAAANAEANKKALEESLPPKINVVLTESDEPFLNPLGVEEEIPWVNQAPETDKQKLLRERMEALQAANAAGKHRVTIIRDHVYEYPTLMMDIHVAGTRLEEAQFAEMFSRSHCRRARSVEEADLVVFTGGPDVDPVLYGEKQHTQTRISPQRDKLDLELYEFCYNRGIPMFGVCRGAQFLSVMNGGKLYQHIDEHHGDHSMVDIVGKGIIERVSSVHHQAVRPNTNGGMEIIGTSNKSKNRWITDDDKHTGPNIDIEAFFYRDTCCFGVQGHPEYRGYTKFAIWTLDMLKKYVVDNPDLDYGTGVARIKADLISQRSVSAMGKLHLVNTNDNTKKKGK